MRFSLRSVRLRPCTRRNTAPGDSIRPVHARRALGELRNGPTRLKVPDQSIAVLQALLERPGELVTREGLRDRLWAPDTFVDFEAGLNAAVRRLREALNDSADVPRYVETLPRRGYRFIAPVDGTLSDPAASASLKLTAASWWAPRLRSPRIPRPPGPDESVCGMWCSSLSA